MDRPTTEGAQRLRVGKAREPLQFGTLPTNGIAAHVGFGDADAFCKVLSRIVGVSAVEYRCLRGHSQGLPAVFMISAWPRWPKSFDLGRGQCSRATWRRMAAHFAEPPCLMPAL